MLQSLRNLRKGDRSAEATIFTPELGKWLPITLALLACIQLCTGTAWADPNSPGSPANPRVPPRLDQYGDPLPQHAIARLGTLRFRDAGVFRSLAYTPDGRTLVSGGGGGPYLWDAATGREIRRFGGKLRDPYEATALSPDGKLVAIASGDEGGALYEVATGQWMGRFGKPGRSGSPACFSHDGKLLAAIDPDFTTALYDTATGALLRSLPTSEVPALRVVFTPDGRTLISTGPNGSIQFWDVASGKEVRRLRSGTEAVNNLAVSSDGSHLALVGATRLQRGRSISWLVENRIRLLDVTSGKQFRQLVVSAPVKYQGQGPYIVRFTPDGKSLLAGGPDDSVRVWDASSGKEVRQFTDHRGPPLALAVAPDGKSFAVVDAYRSIRVRDLTTGRDLLPTGGHRDALSTVAVSRDGRAVATTGWDRKIILWELGTGRELGHLASDEERLPSLAYSPDGRILFSSDDKKLRGWDLGTAQELGGFKGAESLHRPLALSSDGKILAAACGYSLLIVDAVTGKQLSRLGGPTDAVSGMAFSADARTLFAWSKDRDLHSWDVSSAKHLRRPCARFEWSPHGVVFSPDCRFVAFWSSVAYIPVVDVATGREIRRLTNPSDAHDQTVTCAAFSPDGRTLVWAGPEDGNIQLVEIATGRKRHQFAGHRGRVTSLAFSRDGRILVSGAYDTTALVWNLTGPLKDEQPERLSERTLLSCWEDLAKEDASLAYSALRKLTADPTRSVPFFARRLHPAVAPDQGVLARLIVDLDSDEFAVREKVTKELHELGEDVFPELRKALEAKPSTEVRSRIVQVMEKPEGWSPQRLQALRSIEALEHIGTPEAQQLLSRLAKGIPQARLTQEAKASLIRHAKRAANP